MQEGWDESVIAWVHNKWRHAMAWSVDATWLWKPVGQLYEFSCIPAALCHLFPSRHITAACVHRCLDAAQPQPQELEIVNKKEELYLQARVGRLPMASL